MSTTPADLSARLLPNLNTGGVTDTLSITVEGDGEPQSAHVPTAEVEKALAGIRAAAGQPEPSAQPKERLGQYLEAVRVAVAPRGPWGPEHDAAAAAVMGLADEEQRELHRDNANLRVMYDSVNAMAGDLIDERDRLRAELEQARSAVLSEPVRQFLAYALHLASDEMASRSDDFVDADRAALVKLQRLAKAGCTCGNVNEEWVEVPHAADCAAIPAPAPTAPDEAQQAGHRLPDTTETSR